MTWAAATGLTAYCAAVVVGRFSLRQRWAGTTFIVVDWKRWTPGEWIAAALGAVGAVGLAGSVVLAAAGFEVGAPLRPSPLWAIPGVGLLVGATALMLWSQLTMGASWRVGVDRDQTTSLITAGPFRWVRNPIYSAMIMLAMGVTVLLPAALTLAGLLGMLLFAEWQVRAVEEPYLHMRHGGAYTGWGIATGRFVPFVGRMTDA